MEANWVIIGITVLVALIVVVLLVRRNLRDKEEAEKFFNEEFKIRRRFEPDNEEEKFGD